LLLQLSSHLPTLNGTIITEIRVAARVVGTSVMAKAHTLKWNRITRLFLTSAAESTTTSTTTATIRTSASTNSKNRRWPSTLIIKIWDPWDAASRSKPRLVREAHRSMINRVTDTLISATPPMDMKSQPTKLAIILRSALITDSPQSSSSTRKTNRSNFEIQTLLMLIPIIARIAQDPQALISLLPSRLPLCIAPDTARAIIFRRVWLVIG